MSYAGGRSAYTSQSGQSLPTGYSRPGQGMYQQQYNTGCSQSQQQPQPPIRFNPSNALAYAGGDIIAMAAAETTAEYYESAKSRNQRKKDCAAASRGYAASQSSPPSVAGSYAYQRPTNQGTGAYPRATAQSPLPQAPATTYPSTGSLGSTTAYPGQARPVATTYPQAAPQAAAETYPSTGSLGTVPPSINKASAIATLPGSTNTYQSRPASQGPLTQSNYRAAAMIPPQQGGRGYEEDAYSEAGSASCRKSNNEQDKRDLIVKEMLGQIGFIARHINVALFGTNRNVFATSGMRQILTPLDVFYRAQNDQELPMEVSLSPCEVKDRISYFQGLMKKPFDRSIADTYLLDFLEMASNKIIRGADSPATGNPNIFAFMNHWETLRKDPEIQKTQIGRFLVDNLTPDRMIRWLLLGAFIEKNYKVKQFGNPKPPGIGL